MAIEDLEPFVGTWDLEARFPQEADAPAPEGEVTTTFEWVLGGAFVLMRSQAPGPIPQGLCVLAANGATEGFTQHYFDSRGVVRVYEMGFDGRTWTLERSTADFTPLDFLQRYVGTFDEDGQAIRGAWEICRDGDTWQKDFELDYLRRT
jgi:hypothetical protein